VQETSFNAKERREEIRERALERDTIGLGWLSATTAVIAFIDIATILADVLF
jgi:hypothetical protein